jgi:hypothetical protein
MARHVDRSVAARASEDPLFYWWHVGRGAEVIRGFVATPEPEAWSFVHAHPMLLLPELVDAAERALGTSRALDGLREMHQSLRDSPLHASFHRLLATALAAERAGSRRVNLERALAVMKEVRRTAEPADREADDRTEHAIRAALDALTPPPEVKPLSLFLDEAELDGLRCLEDRRDANPPASDRMYAAQGGLAAGSVVWLGDEAAPVYSLVDTRWLFASSKHAKAYVDAPATHLVAGDGLPNPAMVAIADGAYAWGGDDISGVRRHVLLFRVDRVVARLDVSEGPKAAQAFQRLARDRLLPYAEAAIRRVRWALAQYWLGIGRGREAARRFVQTKPRAVRELFADYPILLLPELPTAMAALGDAGGAAAERLASHQAALKSNWPAYREIMRALVRTLLDATTGEPRVNADAAYRLVVAHRRLDSDYAWAALETECSARIK